MEFQVEIDHGDIYGYEEHFIESIPGEIILKDVIVRIP